jgi:hypothetical protein
MHNGNDVAPEAARFVRDLVVALETNSPLTDQQAAFASLIDDAFTFASEMQGATCWEERARASLKWVKASSAFRKTLADLAGD